MGKPCGASIQLNLPTMSEQALHRHRVVHHTMVRRTHKPVKPTALPSAQLNELGQSKGAAASAAAAAAANAAPVAAAPAAGVLSLTPVAAEGLSIEDDSNRAKRTIKIKARPMRSTARPRSAHRLVASRSVGFKAGMMA